MCQHRPRCHHCPASNPHSRHYLNTSSQPHIIFNHDRLTNILLFSNGTSTIRKSMVGRHNHYLWRNQHIPADFQSAIRT